MMKKYSGILLICLIALFTSGCKRYIHAYSDNADFYGVYKSRDLIHADLKMFKKDTNVTCDGVIFLKPDKQIVYFEKEPIDADLMLGCSDKTLLKARIRMNKPRFEELSGTGIDQFENDYVFRAISRKEFKANVGRKKYKFVNDKSGSLLKY
ncbi:MAG: hypothetical protein K6E29_03645 [Cyanobacteria bacterium RUI128]|nr:hypothetical protein [Cyanobacteria bacterium RUI128]